MRIYGSQRTYILPVDEGERGAISKYIIVPNAQQ